MNMSEISASAIKDLREMTGAGMMDCKKALTETKGEMQEAVDWLRKKGLASAAKKSGRVAAEGLVAVSSAGNTGAIIELNAETDFVARNDQFQALAKNIAGAALQIGHDVEQLKQAKDQSGAPVSEQVAQLVGKIGENMNLRRSARLEVENGVVASYVHSAVAPGLGKIGVLVALESAGDKEKLEALGKQIAMHIAAARPDALSVKDVDPAKLTRERAVFKEQAIASGKPAEIAEKMVEGRVRKYYEEVVLLEQIYVIDNKTKISQVIADAEKTVGAPVTLAAFAHFKLGDGIEKQESDFAAEVAATASGAAA
jgi:elongation factor Ts